MNSRTRCSSSRETLDGSPVLFRSAQYSAGVTIRRSSQLPMSFWRKGSATARAVSGRCSINGVPSRWSHSWQITMDASASSNLRSQEVPSRASQDSVTPAGRTVGRKRPGNDRQPSWLSCRPHRSTILELQKTSSFESGKPMTKRREESPTWLAAMPNPPTVRMVWAILPASCRTPGSAGLATAEVASASTGWSHFTMSMAMPRLRGALSATC
mmetsp:Transcript_92987/g.277564  ORF Transcript_92987/g.277564 Transcript_92987/m.277564 type:complete len:213 (+) Transcript_92987:89-727(+)